MLVAQLVEQQTLNLWVRGSTPRKRTNLRYLCPGGETGKHAGLKIQCLQALRVRISPRVPIHVGEKEGKKMGGKFQPWKSDKQYAWKLVFLSIVLFLSAFFADEHHFWKLGFFFLFLGIYFSFQVKKLFRQAKTRKFGQDFEALHSERAKRVLESSGFHVRQNVMTSHLGDIDLVVSSRGRDIPIEIKSFIRWDFSKDHPKTREGKTILQSIHQQNFLHSPFSIIWMPQGRNVSRYVIDHRQDGRSYKIIVISGSEKNLLSAISG